MIPSELIVSLLDEFKQESPDQILIVETPEGSVSVRSWKVGRGFVDVRTNETIQPVYLFRFAPPKA